MRKEGARSYKIIAILQDGSTKVYPRLSAQDLRSHRAILAQSANMRSYQVLADDGPPVCYGPSPQERKRIEEKGQMTLPM